LHGQGAARAKIILHIHNDECVTICHRFLL
jgi:hypothetical protein